MPVCNYTLHRTQHLLEIRDESINSFPQYQSGISLESQNFPLRQNLHIHVYQHFPSPRGDSQSSSGGDLFSSSSSERIKSCNFNDQQADRRCNDHQGDRLYPFVLPDVLRYILLRSLLHGFAKHPVNARRCVHRVDTTG